MSDLRPALSVPTAALTKLRTLPSPKRAISIVMAAFFPAFVTTMVAFFGHDQAHVEVGVVAIVVGSVLTFFAFKWVLARAMHVEIDEAGIRAREPKVITEVRWSEQHDLWIYGVQFTAVVVPLGSHTETTITAPGGRRIFIGMAAPAIHQEIHERSTANNLQRVCALLDANHQVAFGPIQISKKDLFIEGHRYAFERIQELMIRDGKLGLRLDGKWLTRHKTMLRDIPNYPTLLAVFQAACESVAAAPD